MFVMQLVHAKSPKMPHEWLYAGLAGTKYITTDCRYIYMVSHYRARFLHAADFLLWVFIWGLLVLSVLGGNMFPGEPWKELPDVPIDQRGSSPLPSLLGALAAADVIQTM
jgi:hypothetical protein